MLVRCIAYLLVGGLVSLTASAHPFLQKLQRATPANRVILVLNYFDTCQVLTQNQTAAFRLLDDVHQMAESTSDAQLLRYVRYVRDTYAKHQNLTNAQKASLFLEVGNRSEADDDWQIAAVCRHLAGQYYFLNEEYGKAFEHLLAANRAFRKIGPARVPEFSRYLYELAFNYYYFQEFDKAIALLKEAARYPPYNVNLAIQTHNTLGMTYMNRGQDTPNDADSRLAERAFREAQRVATGYGDSLWIGIAAGSIGIQCGLRNQWGASLRAYRTYYDMALRFGGQRDLPDVAARGMARAFFQLGQLDSCRYYLDRAAQFRRRNRHWEFGSDQNSEYERMHYYDVLRLYYRAVGNLPVAYRYLDSTTTLRERISKRYSARRVLLAEQKLLIQQHQSEVIAMEQQGRAQRLQFGAMGVTLALVSLLFFLLYRSSRIRRRQEHAISVEQEKSLRLQKRIVEDELGRAKADLDVFVDNLREKNTLIDVITAELNGLHQHNAQHEFAETHQNLLDASLLTNDDWDEFRRRFERVHPNFFGHLKSQFTDISPAEQRLLALAKLNLDTRQMSRMLGISPDSIRKTKYRLRKKLGVDGHSPLLELLHDPA